MLKLRFYATFDQQQAAMYVGTSQDTFARISKERIGLAPLPHFEDSGRGNSVYFGSYSISSKSKHPQEAWEFIRYLVLSKNEDAIKFTDHYIPTSDVLIKAVNSDPIKKVFIEEMKYASLSIYDKYPFAGNVWTSDLNNQFKKLLTANSSEIPRLLHDFALKLDAEKKKYASANL